MGAMLAAHAARQSNDVNSVVLWEPVQDGARYLKELRAMHRKMLDLWVCKMKTPNDDQVEEILGSRYARSLINSIEHAKSEISSIIQPQLIVVPEHPIVNFFHMVDSIQRVIRVEDEYNWDDLRSLETAWLRSQTAREIVLNTKGMFERLNEFNALAAPATVPAPAAGDDQGASAATGVTA